MIFKAFLKSIYNLAIKIFYLKIKRDKVAYAKKLGVTVGKLCEFWDDPDKIFGSEPYLIKLGNHVRINTGVRFVTHDGGVWILRNIKKEYNDIDIVKPIEIGDNVHIGTNAIIMPGVKIGNNVIVGCAAVVTKNISDNCIVGGIPARIIENIDTYEQKNLKNFIHTKLFSNKKKKAFLFKKFNLIKQ